MRPVDSLRLLRWLPLLAAVFLCDVSAAPAEATAQPPAVYLRAMPASTLLPYCSGAVAFFRPLTNPGAVRFEIVLNPDGTHILMMVAPQVYQSVDDTASNDVPSDEISLQNQPLWLPPGMAERILAALRRAVDAAYARPANAVAAAHGRSAIRAAYAPAYAVGVCNPDGSWRIAGALPPLSHEAACWPQLFALTGPLPQPPPLDTAIFSQMDALLSALKSDPITP